MAGGADPPADTGYEAVAEWPCGAVWRRWVTPTEAAQELLRTAFAAGPN